MLGQIIDLFRKGFRLRNPEGLKSATAVTAFLLALHGIALGRGINVPWLTPEVLASWGSTLAVMFGTFFAGSTVITTRKIGLPFLSPKSMASPSHVDAEAWAALDPVRGSFVGANSSGMRAAATKNRERIAVVPASFFGLSYRQAVEHLKHRNRFIARPSWISKRGYLLRLDSDARHNANQLSQFLLGDDFLPAVVVPWLPSDDDRNAMDWFVIDGWDTGSDEYLNPAQPDVGCQVKVANHNGQLVMEKDFCILPSGALAPVDAGKKSSAVVVKSPPVGATSNLSEKALAFQRYLDSPCMRAFLHALRLGEGTRGEAGYRTLFGGELFESFADHPRRVVKKSGYKSSAAGAYQFLRRTWDEVAETLWLPDFSPPSQDVAAVFLINRRGALEAVLNGEVQRAVHLCRKEWASLPGSPHGQPTVAMDRFMAEYESKLAEISRAG